MDDRDPAAGRYWLMQLMRLSGVVLVVIGAMILAGQIDLPEVAGMVLIVLGAAEFFVVPLLLARRWKSPDR